VSAGTTGRSPADAAAAADPATAAAGTTGPLPAASIEEQLRAVERDVRDLVRLHGELARAEASAGLLHLVIGLFMLGVGIFVAGFVMLAGGFALYLLLVRFIPPAGAASTVALVFALVSLAAWFVAWRFLQGAGSLSLPRTRAMISELLTWRQKPNSS
jgi:MFS family permease